MVPIFESLFNLLFWIVNTILSKIPQIHMPADSLTALTSAFDLVKTLGFFIPLGTLTACGIILIIVMNAEFMVKTFFRFLGILRIYKRT